MATAALCLSLFGLTPGPTYAAQQHQHANLYAHWNFGGATGFWNVDQHVLIGQKARYSYWAQAWSWTNSPNGGYMGIQTDGNRFDGTTGDTAIFSLWDATAASGPSCDDFTNEGEGLSCRLAYPIAVDRYYRLRVWRLHADSQGQWWGAWIRDETTGAESHIGNIRVDRAYTAMAPPLNFSEYFGPAVSCDAVPVSVAYWTQPAANRLGDGGYEHGSSFSSGSRGACTGGSVTAHDFGWTRGARIVQGGPRDGGSAPPPGEPPPEAPPATPAAVTGNLLRDASFELRGQGWTAGNSRDIDWYAYNNPARAHEGRWYMDVSAHDVGASLAQTVPVVPRVGRSYTFSMWVRAPGAPVSGTLALWGLGSTNKSVDTNFTATDEWQLVSVPLSPTSDAHRSLKAEVYVKTTGRHLNLDGGQLSAST